MVLGKVAFRWGLGPRRGLWIGPHVELLNAVVVGEETGYWGVAVPVAIMYCILYKEQQSRIYISQEVKPNNIKCWTWRRWEEYATNIDNARATLNCVGHADRAGRLKDH